MANAQIFLLYFVRSLLAIIISVIRSRDNLKMNLLPNRKQHTYLREHLFHYVHPVSYLSIFLAELNNNFRTLFVNIGIE